MIGNILSKISTMSAVQLLMQADLLEASSQYKYNVDLLHCAAYNKIRIEQKFSNSTEKSIPFSYPKKA